MGKNSIQKMRGLCVENIIVGHFFQNESSEIDSYKTVEGNKGHHLGMMSLPLKISIQALREGD